MEGLSPQQVLDIQRDIFGQALSYNIAYLAIAVTIVLAFLVLFNFINLQPLSKKLDKQESDIKRAKNEVGTAKGDIQTAKAALASDMARLEEGMRRETANFIALAEERLSKLESKTAAEFKELKDRALLAELNLIWDQHYIWEAHKVPTNVLSCLIELIEKNVENKTDYLIDLALNKMLKTLGELSSDTYRKINTASQEHEKLIKALSQLKGHDEKVRAVTAKAGDLMADGGSK